MARFKVESQRMVPSTLVVEGTFAEGDDYRIRLCKDGDGYAWFECKRWNMDRDTELTEYIAVSQLLRSWTGYAGVWLMLVEGDEGKGGVSGV